MLVKQCDWQEISPGQWQCRRCGTLVVSTVDADGKVLVPPLDQLPPCGQSAFEADDDGPPLAAQAVGYAKALARWIAAGRPTRPPALVQQIYQVCTACDRFDPGGDRCRLCGCRVNQHQGGWRNKIAMATESCPLGKW